MLNRIDLLGRLCADPELRQTQSGVSVVSFRLAVDQDYANKETGERGCDFINIVAWRGTAEFVSRYFTKGQLCVVSGRLQMRNYTDRDGNKRTIAEVVANDVYFAGGRNESKHEGEPEYTGPQEFQEIEGTGNEDELPF